MLIGNELAPRSTLQTVFASLVVIMGAIVTAFIFGNIAALVAQMNQKDTKKEQMFDFVTSTMRSIRLPESLQNRVIQYINRVHESPEV
jgi:hypothetical protein